MEYLVALLTLLAAVGYAVFIAVNIEKGKSWAVEIARAISMMDPNGLDRPLDVTAESRAETPEVEAEVPERLAA